MVEDFLEFILTIIFKPFEPWFNNLLKKSSKYNKFFRVLIKVVVFILLIGIIVGINALVNFAIKGYWF